MSAAHITLIAFILILFTSVHYSPRSSTLGTTANMSASSSENTKRRIPEERGPFGKARKRGVSRSKTPNISSANDLARQENLKRIDDIFTQYKADDRQKSSLRQSSSAQAPVSATAPGLTEAGPLNASFQPGPSRNGIKVPTEVMLWGFGDGQQYAAIARFEEISGGLIYEEYERQPSEGRYNINFSASRPADYSKLSTAQIAKINEYVGGDHWIKVTFDSAEAADRAIEWGNGHIISGHEVRAAYWYPGMKPIDGDLPIPAGSSATLVSSPNTVSSATLPGSASQSSATASSATATATAPTSIQQRSSRPRPGDLHYILNDDTPLRTPQTLAQPATAATGQPLAQTSSSQLRATDQSTLRFKSTAKYTVKVGRFQDSKVFLPTRPKWQQTLSQLPVIGWAVGTGNGLIGDQVPRDADGRFDHKNASLYWRAWYAIDACFGTDFCGVKEIEYED